MNQVLNGQLIPAFPAFIIMRQKILQLTVRQLIRKKIRDLSLECPMYILLFGLSFRKQLCELVYLFSFPDAKKFPSGSKKVLTKSDPSSITF